MQTANDSARMNTNSSVWILDDDRSIRWVLEKSLSKNGLATQSFESGGELLNRLSRETPDAIISDIRCRASTDWNCSPLFNKPTRSCRLSS